jgi:uncharacterized protein RhaS with RHS repeats
MSHYDPSVGRYISADHVGQLGGINVSNYALNNPVNWFDPFGLAVDIVINRTGTTPNSLAGSFSATSDVTGGSVSGHTLEDPNPPNPNLPAPPGSYSAHVDSRPGRPDRIELDNVPNATDVQLHIGNTAADVDGCFAVGNTAGDGFVGDSTNAMNGLNNLIAADGTGNITVTIRGSGNSSQPAPNSSQAPPNISVGP